MTILRPIRTAIFTTMAMLLLGCTITDETVSPETQELAKIQYLGAPIVSIKQTSVDWEYKVSRNPPRAGRIKVLYRLETEKPLPYDMKVRLKVQGRTNTVEGWTGIIDSTRSHKMLKDTAFSGKELTFGRFSEYEKAKDAAPADSVHIYRPIPRVLNKLWVQTLTVSIEPWDAIGDDAYNVGSPRTFTVNR